ncbi:MAG: discoidin domain-containing protein [Candidatus Latescibacterota bacterium]
MRTRARLTALLAAAWLLTAAGAARSDAPAVVAMPLAGPVTLDGRLLEPDWQAGAWATGFHVLNRPGQPAEAQTRFKVRFDASRLYVGVEADEPRPDLMRTRVTQRDGAVYGDDCLEVMVDATGQRVEYYHFIANALGTLYDAQMRQGGHVRSAPWHSSAAAAAHVASDRWSVELAVPLVELGLAPASTGEWAVNVTRERHAGGEELSTYAPMSGSFHQAALYARLRLPGADLACFLWGLEPPQAQRVVPGRGDTLEYVALTRVTNATGQARGFRVRALLGGVAGPWVQGRLEAGSASAVEVRVPGIQTGTRLLQLHLVAAEDTSALLATRQLEVTTSYRPLAVDVQRPFYRHTIYATEDLEEIAFEVRSDVPEEELQGMVLHAALRPGAGSPLSSVSQPARPAADLRFPAAGLAVGDYLLEVTLTDARRGEVRHRVQETLHKLPPVAEEWRVDADLVLRHNGQPVLPFGWFSMPPEAMADTGHAYNLIQSYGSHWLSVEEVRRFLDRAVVAGTAATIYPYPYPQFLEPASAWGQPLTPQEEADLRQRVRALRDHPGLFAWYMADEPELAPALPERCRRIYEVVRQEDPLHPCIMLNDTEPGIHQYRGGGDVLMPDPYPLFLQGGLAAEPLEKVGRFLRAAMEAGGGRQPVWVTPQGFNYGDYGQQNNRAPRLLELRNQLYQAAVYGARGFLWYTYSQVSSYPDLDIGMCWLSREVADLGPYLLAPVEAAQIEVEAAHPEHVHAALRTAGGHRALIVVSTDTVAQDVALRVPALAGTDLLHVVSEGRTVEVDAGTVRDGFDVYQTHIYATDPVLASRPNIAVPTAAIARADAARRKPGNLAFEDSGVRVTVSSETEYGSTPTRLTDGVTGGMRWRDGTPGEGPDWVQLTWPAEQSFGRVVLHADGIGAVEVQVPQPGDVWRTVSRADGVPAGPVEIRLDAPTQARQLRLVITDSGTGARQPVVYEVEVYGR